MRQGSRRLSVMAAVAGLLVLVGLSVHLVAPAGHARAREPVSQQVRDAVQFREDFGFRSDRAFVRRTLDDPAYSNMDWGVPLDAAEAADIEHRIAQRSLMGEAIGYATTQADSGGLYIDQRNHGWPVFLFTGDIDEHRAAIDARLPDSVQFTVRKVARTSAELLAMQDAIDADARRLAKEGVRLVSTGPDTIHNTLEVGVLAGLGHARQILARYGDGIVVQLEQPSQLDDGLPPTDSVLVPIADRPAVPPWMFVALLLGAFGGWVFAVRIRDRRASQECVSCDG